MRTVLSLLSILALSACTAHGAGSHEAGPPTDAAFGSADSYDSNPDGFHLLVNQGVVSHNGFLKIKLLHEAYYEHRSTPDPDFGRRFLVQIPLTDDLRRFLCVVFTPDGTDLGIDAAQPGFLEQVGFTPEQTLLTVYPSDYTSHPQNIATICGRTSLPAVPFPAQIHMTKPWLPDLAFVVPIDPNFRPIDIVAGKSLHGHLARGIFPGYEQAESMPISALILGELP